MSLYDLEAQTLNGQTVPLANYKGKVLLIVNTASKCGFTPQYEGLEALYRKYRDKGLEILAFPCNQFGAQEPGNAEEIASFCSLTYDVTFPMFGKIEVNGPQTHPLYAFLKAHKKGLLGSEGIKWNFTKFLVDRTGAVKERYAPTVTPAQLDAAVAALL
jgi:glutathione peroxidase